MPKRKNIRDETAEAELSKIFRTDKESIIELFSSVISKKVRSAKGSAINVRTGDMFNELIGRSSVTGYVAYRSLLTYYLNYLASKGYAIANRTRYHNVFTIPKRINGNIVNPLFNSDPELLKVFLKSILGDA